MRTGFPRAAREERPTVTNGVVASATSRTMVVRTGARRHVLFVLDRETARPARIAAGARVRVSSRPYEEGIRVATRVTVTAEVAPAQAGALETEPVPARAAAVQRAAAADGCMRACVRPPPCDIQ